MEGQGQFCVISRHQLWLQNVYWCQLEKYLPSKPSRNSVGVSITEMNYTL